MFRKFARSVVSSHGSRPASSLPAGFNPQGCVAAPFTPFKSNGDVDFDKFPAYLEHMKQCGVPSVFANGTTGEGLSLTLNERKALAETWIKSKDVFEHVILHIGAANLRESQELAAHAESLNAEAIACISPSYFKPQDEEALVEYMQQVSEAAPNTPFYLYDINFMTNIYLSMPRFLELAEKKIPRLVGIKHSSIDIGSMTRCHQYGEKKYQILVGSDDLLLSCLPLGLDVTVPNTFMAPLQNRMREGFYSGDLPTAKLWQERCFEISSIRGRYGSDGGMFAVSRAIVAMLDVDLGPPRLPLKALSLKKYRELKQDLENTGFFKWVS